MAKQVSHKKRLALGSVLRVGYRLANIAVAFALTPFIIHMLGAQDYGLWAVVGAFLGYYGLLDLGIGASVSRYVAASLEKGDHPETNRIVSTAMAIYAVIAGVVILVTIGVAAWAYLANFPSGRGAEFAHMVAILGVTQALVILLKAYSGVLTADLRFDIQTGFQFGALVVRTGLIIGLLLGGAGVIGMAYASAITYIIALALPYLTVRRSMPFVRVSPSQVSRKKLKQLFSFSMWTFVSKVAFQVRFQIDAIVIVAFLSLTAVAHYKIAAMLVQNFRMGMDAIFGVLFPYFSRLHSAGDMGKTRRVVLFGVRRATQISMIIGFCMVGFGMPFIEYWVGEEFLVAYPCLVILAVSYIFALGQGPAIHYLAGISKNKFVALINTVEAVCNLALSLVLIGPMKMNIVGVAYGTAIPLMLVNGVMLPVYVSRQLDISVVVYMKNLLRSLSTGAVALIIPAYIASQLPQHSLLAVVGQGALATGCYFMSLWLLESVVENRSKPANPLRWVMALPQA